MKIRKGCFIRSIKRQSVAICALVTCIFFLGCQEETAPTHLSPAVQQHLQDYAPPGGTWGFIDAAGQIAIKAQYDEVRDFRQGYAPVCKNGLWGFIDKQGKFIVEPTYIKLHVLEDGVSRARGSNGKMGLINVRHDTIAPFIYDDIYAMRNGYFIVSTSDKKGIIDGRGSTIMPMSSAQIKILSPTLFARKNGEKWEIVNKDEAVIQSSIDAIKKSQFISIDGKWGYIDQNGKTAIPIEENYLNPAHEGHVIAKRGKSYGLLHIETNEFIPWGEGKLKYLGAGRYSMKKPAGLYVYDESRNPITAKPYASIYSFVDGVAAASKDGYWGYIDINGNEIIPPIFPLPWESHENKIRFFTGSGFGYHTTKGEIVIEPSFADTRDFSDGMAAYSE